jgi:hypothetical protein
MSRARVSKLGWYARRAARMAPSELAWRARDQMVRGAWSGRQVTREQLAASLAPLTGERRFGAVLPPLVPSRVPPSARDAIVAAAEGLMAGKWEVLGVTRDDMVMPDWFGDPVTGRRAPSDRYAFRINHRSQEQTGNVKQVWEISRLQHLTLLASAWYLTGDERYAGRVAGQLQSWWQENPFLSGVHWTSGIELGIRMISLAWIRRLLDGWPEVAGLFERNSLAVQQIYWHQQYIAAFHSHGSSANNHVIAEAAGLLVGSCAFPWYAESRRWRQQSALLLERELVNNTYPSGINRELASGYQCFVAELGLLAAVESQASDRPLRTTAWQQLCAMVDSSAALLDERMRPPRQGDGDEGRALLLDDPAAGQWPSLLALGDAVLGRLDWWPRPAPDARSSIIAELVSPVKIGGRPAQRPYRFPDAGITLLRSRGDGAAEIWCRCDGGAHGFLSIAAHAHADALSAEVRYGGVDILADPGTYCYHGDPAWRSYFRSTIAHNTVELDGQSQSAEGGPFLWLRHASAREIAVRDDGDTAIWIASHDGYLGLEPSAQHQREIRLSRTARCIEFIDEVSAGHQVRLAFHLGPEVHAALETSTATLRWQATAPGAARLKLPGELSWTLHRGQTDPILGWYSAGLGQRVPAFTLLGSGQSMPGQQFVTRLEFVDAGHDTAMDGSQSAISWNSSDARLSEARRSRMEAG